MTCTFFGHKDTPDYIKEDLQKAIINIIENEGGKIFFVGNNGNFDFLAQRVLAEIIKIRTDITYYIVLSSIDECALNGDQNRTIFPEDLANTPPKFSICKRNDWLIKRSALAITYVNYSFSNCQKWQEKAVKKGLKVIRLGSI